MGINLEFLLGSQDGLLGHFLSLPHNEIEARLLRDKEDFPDNVDDAVISLAQNLRARGIDALQVDSSEQALVVDDLLIMCYADFSHWLPLGDSVGSIIRACSYDSVLERLRLERAPQEIIKLWEFFNQGRPFLRDPTRFPFHPCRSGRRVFRLGYWTAEEVLSLRPWLEGLTEVNPDAVLNVIEVTDAAVNKETGLIFTVS